MSLTRTVAPFSLGYGAQIYPKDPHARNTNVGRAGNVDDGWCLRSWDAKETFSISSVEAALSWRSSEAIGPSGGISCRPLDQSISVEKRGEGEWTIGHQKTLKCVVLRGRAGSKVM